MTAARPPAPHALVPALAAAALFLAVQVILAGQHEMWRDELQAWMLARDSASLTELLQNLRYEGHPALWHLLLMPLTRLSDGPEAMQVLHVLIATGTVYLVMRHAPFGLVVRVLLCLSYFLFYEYAQLARNYAPGVFLAFAFCALFPARRRHVLALAALLFLLAQTSVFGTFLAAALGAALLVEELLARQAAGRAWRLTPRVAAAALIILAGLALAVVQLRPPADSGFATAWYFGFETERLRLPFVALIDGYLPFPLPGPGYWNEVAMRAHPALGAIALLAVLLAMAVFIAGLRRRPAALVAFLLATIACLAFFYVKYPGSVRHHGIVFIALVVALWIAPSCTATGAGTAAGRWQRASAVLLLLILAGQAAAGLTAALLDWRYPFSQAKATAGFISQHAGPADMLVGAAGPAASAVAGYLHRPVHYLESGSFGTFVRWDNRRKPVRDVTLPAALVARLDATNHIFLIANRALDLAPPGLKVRLAFASGEAAVPDEGFFVYEISR
ncbi:hypothetical protein DK847_03905 [Aestuariivirga litoralis]|uniref:Glycosyltransferase RgtA/B/C/D-like domain-containing protein n=1 Tax=Aestuariivirga litoralis TaxID=2650924 RepID=A0A2W2BZK1_9HYPH|nr:hypothetical protein [Aestuariivirga litoralis]PZF78936.1 hypothetical protein DK847_03905 [Aestuariivirga litoralis]